MSVTLHLIHVSPLSQGGLNIPAEHTHIALTAIHVY